MSKQPTNSRSKLLIPALLVVLLFVLLWPSRKDRTDTVSARPRARAAAATNTTTHLTSVSLPGTHHLPALPVYSLSDAIAIDPFEQPVASVPPAPTVQIDEPVVEPQKEDEGVEAPEVSPVQLQAIFFDRTGAAAIIDDHIFRAGDQLTNGRTILKITRQGVELSP